MSNERNVEAVGCDASIMKNVWEIREREYEQKIQQEQERMAKSALPSINKEWAGRLAARQGNYKRPERKQKSDEAQEEDNVWKTKPQVPPPKPRSVPSSVPQKTRPGVQSRAPSTPSKDKKLPDKNLMKLQLLTSINQALPSNMVWGKSWKFNKSLPPLAEDNEAQSDWGQCWMFATQQPFSEAGQPWKNGPNMTDPNSMHFWEKPETRLVETEELDLSLPEDEWHASWRRLNKTKKDTDSMDGENLHKYGMFSLLVQTQRHNEELCTSEWDESWMSTKPSEEDYLEEDERTAHVGPMEQNNAKNMASMLEGWKLANHHGGNNIPTTEVKKSLSPVWNDSWRAAMMVFNNNNKNSDASMKQGYMGTHDDHGQHGESHIYRVSLASQEKKYRNLYSQLWDEFQALSEWTKSWQVTKNNSKPCEEIEKVLKLSQEAVLEVPRVESKAKEHSSTSSSADPRYEQLRHSVMYHPRREFTQAQLLRLKRLENVLPTSEWKESWKTVKHQMRMERRRYRPDPSSPFRRPERGGDRTPAASEWKDSWKYTCQPLQQEPDQWQQGWTALPQIRVDRAREWNHFAPVDLPKNGPTTERGWEHSWRFLRHQRQSEPGQVRAQTSQGRSSVPPHHPDHSQRRYVRSVSDWREAWMVSETQFRHDRPSLTQWRDAWQWSIFHTEHWTDQMPRENRLSALMEIQPPREWITWQRAQTRVSRSFDNKMFRERYPEKEWNASWKAGKLLGHMASVYGSSGPSGKTMSSPVQQQHGTTNGHGSKWGRPFRIANPMPQLEQPWVQSSPNPSQYAVMWFRGMTTPTPNKINPKFSNSPANFSQWGSSHRFLQGGSSQTKDKRKFQKPVDPMVIIARHINSRVDLYAKLMKVKQADKTWAGCHLLGKTQPRPKKGASSAKMPSRGEEDDDLYAEWVDSWKFLVKPASLRKMPVVSLKRWNESWKCLIPPYPPTNGPKTR